MHVGEPNDLNRTEAREAVYARTAKRKGRILEQAKQHGRITNNDVEDLFAFQTRQLVVISANLRKMASPSSTGRAAATFTTHPAKPLF